MQSGGATKNPPWARSNVNTNMTGMNPQIMDPNAMMTQQGMMPFQQSQAVFNTGMMQTQGGMTLPMAGQMQMNQMAQGQIYPGNVVAYPAPRSMNPALYQNAQTNQTPPASEQRVFTGTVTKTHNDFGFVDHDVFYQTSVCAKGIIPKLNDRVLVEATYNPNMPFKWNATRVQVLPKSGPNMKQNPPKSHTYNAVPPPVIKKSLPPRRDDRRDDRISRRDDRKRSRTRSRSRSRDRREVRSRRDSPPRKRPVVTQPSPVKYVVRVPRIPLDIQKMDVPALSQRYTNMYIPSDFFAAHVKWGETFPPQAPFSLNNPCAYHIMSKEAENPIENDAVLEPPDADYRFSAKVMLISMPSLETLYQKCGLTKSDDKDKRMTKTPLHPTRLIKFLVGQKGKGGENFAIGGPWSPSLDGENPQSDPRVLVRTAIRTCKALTGIDLSSCTQWYRMVEFHYWREGGGRSRLETVALLLPAAWGLQPGRDAWPGLLASYSDAAQRRLQPSDGRPDDQHIGNEESDAATITIDENDDEEKLEPTHYSKLDVKSMTVDEVKRELRARHVSSIGPSTELTSRLTKLLNAEEVKESKPTQDVIELEDDEQEEAKEGQDGKSKVNKDQDLKEKEQKQEKKSEKEIEEEKKKLEKEKQAMKARYELPTTPHIIVHPSSTAKGGKFQCSVATLSLLLDYRITDNKEHSFELFVFAELFNEMLMRDFGFYIYKTLYMLPEKIEEVTDKSSEKTDKKDDKKQEDKKEERKDDKSDKRDDRRDSRRRDRKESPSDDERSDSPRRRGRGVELPPDPYLLLSLVYFDTSRGGTITKKDLQNLFMSLGLQLSRSQIKAILDKVCVKDVFNYKSLTQAVRDVSSGSSDLLQDPTENPDANNTEASELELTIAAGNRDLLPVFDRPEEKKGSGDPVDIGESGCVVWRGRVVGVGALVREAGAATAARVKLESALAAARAALAAARARHADTQQAERGKHHQLESLSARLAAANKRLAELTASSKIFHSTLKSIQSKVEAVVNIKFEDDDVVEIINGPSTIEKKDKKEESNKEEIKNEKPAIEESKKEEPEKEESKIEELVKEESKIEEPVKEESKIEEPDKKEKVDEKESEPTIEEEAKPQESETKEEPDKDNDNITAENMDLDDKE